MEENRDEFDGFHPQLKAGKSRPMLIPDQRFVHARSVVVGMMFAFYNTYFLKSFLNKVFEVPGSRNVLLVPKFKPRPAKYVCW